MVWLMIFSVVEARIFAWDGLAWNPVYGMGTWMVWKGSSCTEWECGWLGKVPRVQIAFAVSSCSNQLRTGCGTCSHVYHAKHMADMGRLS
jgi:hypothetical protein